MEEQEVYGYEFEGTRYDAGTTMGWLKASVELALQRPDLGHRVPRLPARTVALIGRSRPRPIGRLRRALAVRCRPERAVARMATRPRLSRGSVWRRSARSWATAIGSIELLGQGGMATIYPSLDTQLGRDVAVKLLRPEYLRDPDFSSRFRQEAQTAASLNHPNVVSVYDYGEDPSGPFIVMELVDGEDLASILRRNGAAARRARSTRIAAAVALGPWRPPMRAGSSIAT